MKKETSKKTKNGWRKAEAQRVSGGADPTGRAEPGHLGGAPGTGTVKLGDDGRGN